MINIVCTHLNSGEIKSTSVDKLTDILVKSEPVVDIPKPKNWDVGEDSLEYNFLPVNLFDKIDLVLLFMFLIMGVWILFISI